MKKLNTTANLRITDCPLTLVFFFKVTAFDVMSFFPIEDEKHDVISKKEIKWRLFQKKHFFPQVCYWLAGEWMIGGAKTRTKFKLKPQI